MKNHIHKLRESYVANILFYVGLIALFGFVLLKNKDSLNVLRFSNVHYFSIVLALSLINVCFRGLLNVVTFNFGTKTVTFWDGYKLAVVNTMGNYLPFSSGLIAKGFLLKNKYEIGYMHYAAISVYTIITALVVAGLYGLYSTWLVEPTGYILQISFTLMVLTGIFILTPIPRIPFIANYYPMTSLQEPRLLFKSVVARVLIVYACVVLVISLRLSYSFQIIGKDVSFVNALMLVSGSMLTRLITLTPGGIGIKEALVAAVACLTGIDYQFAIIAAGIDRLAEIFMVFGTGGIIFLWDNWKIRHSGKVSYQNDKIETNR